MNRAQVPQHDLPGGSLVDAKCAAKREGFTTDGLLLPFNRGDRKIGAMAAGTVLVDPI